MVRLGATAKFAPVHAAAHTASQAAVSTLTSRYAEALPGMRVNVVDRGLTRADSTAALEFGR